MDPLDVICVGETLVDFLPDRPGKKVRDVETWVRCSGGSPANVAVGLSRLGARSAMVGVVGEDEFGEFLIEKLADEGVDVTHLRQTDEGKTGLVFISLSEGGERTFSFYRTRAAELFLAERDIDPDFFSRTRAVHVGTNSLLFREAQRAAVKMAKAVSAAGKILCCDPNLRLHLWPDPRELREVLNALIPQAAVVKISEEEMEFVTGKTTPEAALAELSKKGVALPIVTLGEKGATFLWNEKVLRVSAPAAYVTDTTGAGDGFVSALLYGITQCYADLPALKRAGVGEIRELVTFGCAVGSKVVEKLGAVAGLPRREEVLAVLPRMLRPATPEPELEPEPKTQPSADAPTQRVAIIEEEIDLTDEVTEDG